MVAFRTKSLQGYLEDRKVMHLVDYLFFENLLWHSRRNRQDLLFFLFKVLKMKQKGVADFRPYLADVFCTNEALKNQIEKNRWEISFSLSLKNKLYLITSYRLLLSSSAGILNQRFICFWCRSADETFGIVLQKTKIKLPWINYNDLALSFASWYLIIILSRRINVNF